VRRRGADAEGGIRDTHDADVSILEGRQDSAVVFLRIFTIFHI
jgi:hypothetical protein